MPEKKDEIEIEEEKDFFDQVPAGQLRLILPKARSTSYKTPRTRTDNQLHSNDADIEVKSFDEGVDSPVSRSFHDAPVRNNEEKYKKTKN